MAIPTRDKLSKHPLYDDPSAFYQRFPDIEEVTDGSWQSPLESIRPVRYFKMGKCRVVVSAANEVGGWFMSVQREDRYPSWDELVWLRYRLIPDAARMANILPNLNSYINKEDTHHKFVFTMEQNGWVFDPHPTCPNCEKNLDMQRDSQLADSATFVCPECDYAQEITFSTWNEMHGNGATVAREEGELLAYSINRMTKGRVRVVGEMLQDKTPFPFDEILTIAPNDSPFNRVDVIALQVIEGRGSVVFYFIGDAAYNPTPPKLMDEDIVLATLSVPSRWKRIDDIGMEYHTQAVKV